MCPLPMARNQTEAKPTPGPAALPFEKPLEDVRGRLRELEELAARTRHDLSEEIQFYRSRLERLTRELYENLSPWSRVQVARHPDRPLTTDYAAGMCTDFVELCGDGAFADDRAILAGLGTIGARKVMLIGHRKGKTTKERLSCNFGSAHPEGYRKALRKMRLAQQMRLPIVCLVDTPGAYPGVGAEERGQARAIAENIHEMFEIRVPIVVVIIGEGGSGGALGIGVGDRVGMLENSWYSVISPEGCASILWHTSDGKDRAAEALKLTGSDLQRLGIIDEVIPEPVGGAHRAPETAIRTVKECVLRWLDALERMPVDRLLAERYRKFRWMAASGALVGGDALAGAERPREASELTGRSQGALAEP